MKICPTCQTRYTDDTLQFCLQDGATLVSSDENQTSMPTVAFPDEQETVVKSRPAERINFELQNRPGAQNRQQQTAGTTNYQSEPPRKSSTGLIVLTTVIATLLIAGLGAAAWIYFGKKENEVAVNNPANASYSNTKKENANAAPTLTPSPKSSEKPTPEPTQISAAEAEEIKKAVNKTIFRWKWSAEGRRLDTYMDNYADRVDYYNKKAASIDTVRADKEKAFSTYDRIKMNLSNVDIKLDDTGEMATAVFDKQWFFESEEKTSEGKVQTQLQLKKIGRRWKITSERDLKVYYTN